jgi:hypothetical protein
MATLSGEHHSGLFNRVRADQSERWRRGERVRVE